MDVFLPFAIMPKVKTTVEIEESLNEKFRKAVVERKGFHKGVLGEAIEEALEAWIDSQQKAKEKKP
jgi:hypothetical protein